MGKPILGYWFLRGLCQPIRLFLKYAEVDFEDKRYTSMEMWEEEKFNLGLDFPNVPYLIDGDKKITESRAIMRYVAHKYAKKCCPEDADIQSTSDMVEGVVFDMWLALVQMCFTGMDFFKETFEKNMPKKFSQMVNFLGDKKFILGDKVYYVDFFLYEVLYHYSTYNSQYLDFYPTLKAYKERIEALPQIKAYIESPEYIAGPCITSKAKIKF